MKRTHRTFILATAVALLAVNQLRAGVKVNTAEPKEKTVAFRVGEKYVTASTSNSLDVSAIKIGSKQTFTLVDITGGEFADGDEVRIRYTPHSSGGGPPKPSYWLEAKQGVRRGRDGDVFKIKLVETKYAFQMPTGKYIAAPTEPGALSMTDKVENALLMELVDPSSAKASKKSAVEKEQRPEPPPAAPPPEKPATE